MSEEDKEQFKIEFYDPITGEPLPDNIDSVDYDVNDLMVYDLAQMKDNIDLTDPFVSNATDPGQWVSPNARHMSASTPWSLDYIPNIFINPQDVGIDLVDKIHKINEQ